MKFVCIILKMCWSISKAMLTEPGKLVGRSKVIADLQGFGSSRYSMQSVKLWNSNCFMLLPGLCKQQVTTLLTSLWSSKYLML